MKRIRIGLFWKIYLAGLGQLLVVALVLLAVVHLVDEPPPWHTTLRNTTEYLRGELSPLMGDPKALQPRLDTLRSAFHADIAVYDGQGALLAWSGEQAPEPSPPPVEGFEIQHLKQHVEVTASLEDGAHLVVHLRRHNMPRRFWTAVFATLAALAALAFLQTRSIVGPLERLTATARRLGDGELSARSGICRSDETGALARSFDDMADKLQSLLRNEKQLLANVSHELRTPLARIRVALELAEEDASDPAAVVEGLAGIEEDLEELELLVGDVLTTARLEHAELRSHAEAVPVFRSQPLDLFAALRHAAQRLTQRHPEVSPTLRLEASGSEPVVLADEALLQRVFSNLLDNAVRYSGAQEARIELAAREEEGVWAVEVRDRGPGVAPEELPRLFEPFFRAERSRSRSTGGSGLGLALVQRVLEAHGGSVSARLREGGGMVFTLTLPAAPAAS